MHTIQVDGCDDPRLSAYTSLTDMDLRLVQEPREGIFLAEGRKIIERALAAGLTPVSAFMEPKWLEDLRPSLEPLDIPVFLGDEQALKSVTGYRLHRGALAAFVRPTPRQASDVIAEARFVVVLDGLVDHTNVGLIFRSAAALGADAVLISPDCADPLYRRSVKVSMGAVFHVPWARAEPWPWFLDDLAQAGFTRVCLTPSEDAADIGDFKAPGQRVALLLGSEGPGLSGAAFARSDVSLRIPMSAGVDSLNVAAATAVACYALRSCI